MKKRTVQILMVGSGPQRGAVDVTLLVLRLFTGFAVVVHGWGKVVDIIAFAVQKNLPLLLAGTAAYLQLVGGVLVLLGLITPWLLLELQLPCMTHMR